MVRARSQESGQVYYDVPGHSGLGVGFLHSQIGPAGIADNTDEDVLPVDQERGGRRVGDPVVLALEAARAPDRFPDVVPADGVRHILQGAQEPLSVERG